MQSHTKPFGAISEEQPDLYEVLQVSPKAEAEVIEAAYKRLAFKYHPDRNSSPEATQRMQELNSAYAIIGDSFKRLNYDRNLLGLPPLEKSAEVVENLYQEENLESSSPDNPIYNWDDLPFSEDKRGTVYPIRGWVKLKIFIYRHRRQILPWFLAFLLLSLLLAIISTQNIQTDQDTTPGKISTTSSSPVAGFAEDFEDKLKVAQNWSLDSPWHLTSRSASSGTMSLWVGDEQTHVYPAFLNASATLNQLIDLTQAQKPLITFMLNGQFDNEVAPSGRDRLFVEVAEPGQDFQSIYSISSTFSNWQMTQVDLGAWKGKVILIRFRFQSGSPAFGYTGPFIDDVKILK